MAWKSKNTSFSVTKTLIPLRNIVDKVGRKWPELSQSFKISLIFLKIKEIGFYLTKTWWISYLNFPQHFQNCYSLQLWRHSRKGATLFLIKFFTLFMASPLNFFVWLDQFQLKIPLKVVQLENSFSAVFVVSRRRSVRILFCVLLRIFLWNHSSLIFKHNFLLWHNVNIKSWWIAKFNHFLSSSPPQGTNLS